MGSPYSKPSRSWLLPGPVGAQDLPHDWVLDGSVIGGGAAVWLSLELLRPQLVTGCRWCATDSLDTGARDALRWPHPEAAAILSDILLGGVPGFALGADALAAAHDDRGGLSASTRLSSSRRGCWRRMRTRSPSSSLN
jgi:hypothetical protein